MRIGCFVFLYALMTFFANISFAEKNEVNKFFFHENSQQLKNLNVLDINDNETEAKDVHITMSLTTPGCSMGQHMANDIKAKVSALDGVSNVDVEVTFDPPWNPEMMTDEARSKLGFDPVATPKNEPKIDVEWE